MWILVKRRLAVAHAKRGQRPLLVSRDHQSNTASRVGGIHRRVLMERATLHAPQFHLPCHITAQDYRLSEF